jgi:hypothetical protein
MKIPAVRIRNPAGLPVQKMAVVGFVDAALYHRVHARESFAWRDFLRTRRPRPIDVEIRVMHQTFVAGPDLDGADPSGGLQVRRENEIPVDVGAGGGKGVRSLRLEDQVRRAKLPAVDELRRVRRIGPFGSARRGPIGECVDLFVGKA